MPLQFTEEDFEPKAGLFKEEDFAPKKKTGSSKLSEFGGAVIEGFRPSTLWRNAIERPATGIYNAIGHTFINYPSMLYKAATGKPIEEPIFGMEGVHSTLPFKPIQVGQPLVDVQIPNAEVNPISAAVQDLATGLSTPGNLAALPVAGGEQAIAKLLRVLFGGQMAEGAVEGGQQALDPNLTPQERQKGAVSALLAGAGGYGIGHSLMPKQMGPTSRIPFTESAYGKPVEPTFPSGIPGSAIPDLRFEDLGIPLPEYLQSSAEPIPRSSLVRESQGPTPILEPPISIPRKEVLIYDRSRPIEQPVVPVKLPVEEAGGKVSFAAPAEAGGVPSAGQSAKGKSVVGEQEALMQGQFVPGSEVGRGTAPYGKGLQTKAGLEKGRARRGETGAINPSGDEGRLSPYKPGDFTDAGELADAYRKSLAYKPAIRSESGKLTTADTHYAAERVANRSGEKGPFQRGYQTQDGRFLTLLEVAKEQQGEGKGLQTKLKPGQGSQSGAIPNPFPAIKAAGTKAKAVAVKLKDYFKGAEDKVLPLLNFKNELLPDFQPKHIANEIASQPFASESVPILGRLMGGKARIRTPQDAAVASWYLERHGIGPAVAAVEGELGRGKLDPVFKIDETGSLNVKPRTPGQSTKEVDVFNALLNDPFAYDLTIPQRKAYSQVIKPMLQRMQELGDKYKIKDDLFDSDRAFTARPDVVSKVEQSLEKRLVARVNHLYRAIANKRLADDPVLGARSRAQVRGDLRTTFAVDLATGKMTEKQFASILKDSIREGRVSQVSWNLGFPPEVAKLLKREFAAESSKIRQGVATANSALKSSTLGFDLGVGQIQLLPLLYRNPKAWGIAQGQSIKSFFRPEAFADYLRRPENTTAAREIAQMGSQMGRLPEFLSELGEGGVIGKVPLLGTASKAFGRQFQTALDVAKLEMYKSLKGKYKTSDWPQLIRSIESTTLSGRSESAGVPHGRALLERVALLAPAYYRGALDLVAGLKQKGVTRKESAKTIGAFVAGGTATFYGVAKLLQMDDDEIVKRMDPSRTDFMTWSVKNGDGAPTNIGFGGIFRSVLRLLGNIVASGRKDPKSLIDDTLADNSAAKHLARFYRSHSGPVVRMGLDVATGEDYMGRKTSLKGLAKSNTPLLAQTAIGNEDQEPAAAAEYGAGLAGLTAFPESYTARRTREGSALARQRFGKDYDRLGLNQRLNVESALDKKFAGVPRGISESKARDLALKKTDERIAKLQKDIGPEMNSWMKENKLKLRGYQVTFDIGGTALRLMSGEAEHLHNLTVKNYKKMYETLKDNPDFKQLDQQQKQEVFDDFLQSARDTAKPYILKGIADLE